ncbi:hypothetical protein ACFQH9_08840 [Pseudonocardia lutea]|uniref:HEAT repeat domain-containing protein n=1 Tax=Pseudonocardia lutea TaxID=2172015 RepID=A0ABW1I6F6_9PSEU
MKLYEASQILRGIARVTTPEDLTKAAVLVLRALDDVYGVRVWAARLLVALDAQDDDAVGRARHGLEDALNKSREVVT